jgi:hypothetical protein
LRPLGPDVVATHSLRSIDIATLEGPLLVVQFSLLLNMHHYPTTRAHVIEPAVEYKIKRALSFKKQRKTGANPGLQVWSTGSRRSGRFSHKFQLAGWKEHEQRLGLLHFLLQRCQNDNLERGALKTAAAFVFVAPGTVSRLWKEWHLKHTNSLNGEWDMTSG